MSRDCLYAHTDLHARLAIAELLKIDLGRFLPKTLTDGVDQRGMRRAAEDARLAHGGGCTFSAMLRTRLLTACSEASQDMAFSGNSVVVTWLK